MLAAAKAAADGEVLIDPATLTRLLAQVARQREEQRDAMALLGDLTEREREILGLFAQGKRNDDIARELYISPQTVQTHVRNILGKLRVHSKLEAVSFAVKHGADPGRLTSAARAVTTRLPERGYGERHSDVEVSGATPWNLPGAHHPLGGPRET